MATYVLKWSDGSAGVAYPDCSGDLVQNRYELDLAGPVLSGINLANNDIIDMGIIPANSTPVDVWIDCDDLDSNGTPTFTFDCGIITGTPGDATGSRTVGTEFFSASTIGQTGGVARTTSKTAFRIAPSDVDRSIGIKVVAAPATEPATGKLAVNLVVKG